MDSDLTELAQYHDKQICELLEFRFPIGVYGDISAREAKVSGCKNHTGALEFPKIK